MSVACNNRQLNRHTLACPCAVVKELQAEHCKGSAGPHVDWFAALCAVVAALADIGVVRLL